MLKTALICIAMAGALMASAQSNSVSSSKEGLISVASRGNDVRVVVHDLFAQAGKNYVLDPSIRFNLYLQLKDVDFEEALTIVCKHSGLQFDLENGIYYVTKAPAKTSPAKGVDPKTVQPQQTQTTGVKPNVPKVDPNKGTLPTTVLQKKINTRFDRTDLREIMAALSKQTGVKIEVDAKVPAYKLDAYLLNTSLKFGLDQITQAANLRYRFTDRKSIEIIPAVSVSVSDSK